MVFRLKLDNALANEMVSKLPESLFLSDCTSFLDPSMGGGQYVVAIEDRLRKMGHSDANIKNRVFGVEKSRSILVGKGHPQVQVESIVRL